MKAVLWRKPEMLEMKAPSGVITRDSVKYILHSYRKDEGFAQYVEDGSFDGFSETEVTGEEVRRGMAKKATPKKGGKMPMPMKGGKMPKKGC